MQGLADFNSWLNGYVWGWPMIILLIGTGVLLTLLTGFAQVRYLGTALKEVLGKLTQKSTGDGSVRPFQAIQAELDLPVAGLMSNQRIEVVVERLNQVQAKARGLGFRFTDAPLTLAVLTSVAVPFLRLSEDGLVNSTTGRVVDFLLTCNLDWNDVSIS